MALGKEAPDEVVVLVAERVVAAPELGMPEPPDEHLRAVGQRTTRAHHRDDLGGIGRERVPKPPQLVGVIPVHPHPEADRLLGLSRGVGQHTLLAQRDEFRDPVGLDVTLRGEAEVALDVDLDPQALTVEPVLPALVVSEHRVEALVEVLVGAAPGVMDAHRVVRGDRAVEEAPVRPPGQLRAQPCECVPLLPQRQDPMLQFDEILFGVDGTEHATSERGPGTRQSASRRPSPRPQAGSDILPAMHRQQAARPRAKSAFAAAFLSLIFPGLGQAYVGAWYRALGFAAGPILIFALTGGFLLRMDRQELVTLVVNPTVLTSVFVLNIIALLYRLIAIIDAYRVATYVNAHAASGDGRLGPAKLPLNPLSVAGLIAIVLIMTGTHVAVARYDMMAMDLFEGGCIFIGDEQGDEACELDASPSPSSSPDTSPDVSLAPASVAPSPTAEPSPVGSALPNVVIPPWDGKKRLNILLIGSDQRPNEGFYNTDTLIVVSVDPETKKVAMFSLPRDVVDVPIPSGPARSLFGSVYAGKINSWFGAIRNREDLFPGSNRTRGYNGLKAILGELYGLDIKYFVEVNFEGFKKVVDAIGGVTVNVQVPVADDQYPGERGTSRLYIPSGLQHMTGTQALRYARSRHTSDDFDRGARQQRLLLSMREQVDPVDLIPRLEELTTALKKAVRTDIPPSEIPKLLGLASEVDTRNIRSYVFAPPLYGTQVLNSPRGYIILPDVAKIRDTLDRAFRGNPANEERRQKLAQEGARVWVLNGTSSDGRGSKLASFLAYQGLAASAPRQRPDGAVPSHTRIVLYNATKEQFPAAVSYLEKTFDVEVKTETDPSVSADFVITIGKDTPNLAPPI